MFQGYIVSMLNVFRLKVSNSILFDCPQELELRIETQKQTLQQRDESIKKLLEMLQSKGEGESNIYKSVIGRFTDIYFINKISLPSTIIVNRCCVLSMGVDKTSARLQINQDEHQ